MMSSFICCTYIQFNRCKLVVLAVLFTSSMGINAICCVLEFLSMGLLFKMDFYVSLA